MVAGGVEMFLHNVQRDDAVQHHGINSFSPTSGTLGVAVTLTDSGFTGATSVTLDGTSAQFMVNSDTQIVTTDSSGTATGPITATTLLGVRP